MMPESGVQSHYITASNVNALLRVDDNLEAHCLRCLHTFAGIGAQQRLDLHTPTCEGILSGGVQRITMPKEGENILKFKDFDKGLHVP